LICDDPPAVGPAQPNAFVVFTRKDTAPLAPAVNVIEEVPCPAVIVPLVICQEYADAPAATEAMLPVDFAQTAGATFTGPRTKGTAGHEALIVAVAADVASLTVIVCVPVALRVIEKTCAPASVAVNV
jgi:hypothetical protein